MLEQPKLSIVFPCYNEIQNGFLERNLKRYSKYPAIELICVDAGSTDGTLELIQKYNAKLISFKSNRIGLLEEGMKKSKGKVVILHHPRSTLVQIEDILNEQFHFKWGAFTHQFDQSHPMLKFTSWWSNFARGDISNIFYLDHCFYIAQDLVKIIEPFPKVDLFEDTEISKVLKHYSAPKRLPYISQTSAVRFQKNGITKQIMLNMLMKIMYFSGFSDKTMFRIYELGLNLNSKSSKN